MSSKSRKYKSLLRLKKRKNKILNKLSEAIIKVFIPAAPLPLSILIEAKESEIKDNELYEWNIMKQNKNQKKNKLWQ